MTGRGFEVITAPEDGQAVPVLRADGLRRSRVSVRTALAIAVLAAVVGYVIGQANPSPRRRKDAAAKIAADHQPQRAEATAHRPSTAPTTTLDPAARRQQDLDEFENDRTWQRIDMLALCADAVHGAGAANSNRSVTLLVGTTDLPPTVIGDAAGLRQVLANLIDDALRRHTPVGTPVEVRLSTSRQPGGETGVLRLEVADNGPGMTPAAAVRAFDDADRLGLPIAVAIVEAHDGQIDIDTQPGHGSCFRVLLPVADQPATRR